MTACGTVCAKTPVSIIFDVDLIRSGLQRGYLIFFILYSEQSRFGAEQVLYRSLRKIQDSKDSAVRPTFFNSMLQLFSCRCAPRIAISSAAVAAVNQK